jgi:hypothetical protein
MSEVVHGCKHMFRLTIAGQELIDLTARDEVYSVMRVHAVRERATNY